MRILVFGTEDYRNIVAKQLGSLLDLTVFTDPDIAINKIHILNYPECSESVRLSLNPDVVIWIDMSGIIENPPTFWDIRLQETLSENHLNKLAVGIRNRYVEN